MTIELDKLPSGDNDTSAPANEFDLASYRAGILCGLEAAAQYLESTFIRGTSYAAGIRKMKHEEILAGGAK